MKIDGKAIAHELIERLKKKSVPTSSLAGILVGENENSHSFIRQKRRIASELGIEFHLYKFDADIGSTALRKEVVRISRQAAIGGVLVQLPLPEKMNRQSIINGITYEKDIDCLTSRMAGEFYNDRSPILPPAVGTVQEIVRRQFEDDNALAALRVAVIGTGILVGKPIASWLLGKCGSLVAFDIHTQDITKKLKEFDLIISGTGKRGLFSSSDIKEEATVIDFGYDGGKGDFDPADADERNIAYTPTPGGTGPIVVAKLFENFTTLTES